MCRGEGGFRSCLLGVACFLYLAVPAFSPVKEFSAVILLNRPSLFTPSGISEIYTFGHLRVSNIS